MSNALLEKQLLEIVTTAYPELQDDELVFPKAAPIQVNELPQFRFLHWMTNRALKRINPDTVRTGARGCIIHQAYGVIAQSIPGPSHALNLARSDYEWSGQYLEAAALFGGPRDTPNVWRPPAFDSDDAYRAADRMIRWNDDQMYDTEKRMLLRRAVEQELERRR